MDREPRSTKASGLLYLVVGGSTALLELVLFQALYALASWSIPAANVTAVVVATATNFALNRNVTFKSTANPLLSLVKYLVLFAFNTAFSTIAISLFSSMGAPAVAVKLATMACIVIWNFFLYRNVVFK